MNEPISLRGLAEIEARANAATPGPWEADHIDPGVWGPEHIIMGNYTAADDYNSACWDNGSREDRDFMAAAREDVPALLVEVHRLQAVIERVRELHYETTWCHSGKVNGCNTCADVESVCDADYEYWPCATITAIEGDTNA